MANPNPSPATRWKPGTSGNPGGKPKGTISPATKLRRAFDREAPIKGKDPGHGITYLDLMIDSIRKQACQGDFKFIQMAFELLEDDAIQSELDQLRALVDGDESGGGDGGDPTTPGDPGAPGG
jgi:hypothetical protein